MLDRPKKRYKDYKHIVTMKRLDTSIYCEGLPYLVKFNGDEKGKGIDYGDGKVGICIEASGGSLTFVFVSGTFVHEEYNTKVVSISCKYLDSSKIEIIPYWSDTDVLKLIDSVKHDPDKYHGYSYWNEEIEIYDQDNVEKEKLNENFRITIDGETYPLLIPKFNKDEQYDFNMDALQILEDKNLMCTFRIKRTHLGKWRKYRGPFRIKVLHNPDGFQMFHTLETDDENMELKDTWFPGDILSNIKGIQIETSTPVKDDTEDAADTEKVEEKENQVSEKDEMCLKEIRQLVDGFENKRFAIASLLAITIDIGCDIKEKEGEKTCVNCPLGCSCREISGRSKMLLSDICYEQKTLKEENKEENENEKDSNIV